MCVCAAGENGHVSKHVLVVNACLRRLCHPRSHARKNPIQGKLALGLAGTDQSGAISGRVLGAR
eukprot:9037631-Pyramimonas_sp.AAC.1